MIPLHTLEVASPCHADWDEMQGDAQIRFCRTCRKNVYNLSEMTHDDAQALVSRLEGRLCVRFYTRADGTLLTQDCPIGLRAVRRSLARKLSYAAAVLLSCTSGLLRLPGTAQAVTVAKKHVTKPHATKPHAIKQHTAGPSHTMGKPVPPPPPPMHTMGLFSIPPRPTMGAPLPVRR